MGLPGRKAVGPPGFRKNRYCFRPPVQVIRLHPDQQRNPDQPDIRAGTPDFIFSYIPAAGHAIIDWLDLVLSSPPIRQCHLIKVCYHQVVLPDARTCVVQYHGIGHIGSAAITETR